MAGKSTRDKDLEALRCKISDREASMDRLNDWLDQVERKECRGIRINVKVNVIPVLNAIQKRIMCSVRRLQWVF